MHKRAALQRFFASFTVIITLSTSVAPAFAQELPVEEVPPVSQNTIETPSVVVAEPATEPAIAPEVAVSTTIPGQTSEEPLVETKIITTSPVTEATQSSEVPAQTMATTSEDLPLDKPKQATAVLPYSELMREIAKAATPDQKQAALKDLLVFIDAEKERLASSPLDETAKNEYIQFLELQKQVLGEPAPEQSFIERAVDAVKSVLGFEVSRFKTLEPKAEREFTFPKHSPNFQPNDEDKIIHSIYNLKSIDHAPSPLLNIFATPVSAANGNAPVIDDITSGPDAIINQEITDLAESLDNNPLKILNYLRSTINFTPYFGTKKGSIGCLHEKMCNDADASALTIALMRAAGIPAHFKKSLVVMSSSTWKNLLGVDELKTVFTSGMYVYTLSPDNDGKSIDDADFSKEQSAAVFWVHPEIYYPYDERGGNFSNLLDVRNVTNTVDLQAALTDSPNRQWIGLDVVVKNYSRTRNSIVAEQANFDSGAFWLDYFKYQGGSEPSEKYQLDLKNQTQKDPFDPGYQSSKTIDVKELTIFPASLPYYTGLEQAGGRVYKPEVWSALPSYLRQSVTITLKRDDNGQIILQHTFYAADINNVPITVRYQGTTEVDQAEIQNHGGIAYTPSQLVNISPSFLSSVAEVTTTEHVKIGDKLVLQFQHTVNDSPYSTDEKFSTAGNEEGIFMTLSKAVSNPLLQTPAQITSAGLAEIARSYVVHVQEKWGQLGQSLDYTVNSESLRAVVTQNRTLNVVNGVPASFEFSGLTMDAHVWIRDYSNRGNYLKHQLDARRLLGLEFSFYEAKVFSDLAALNSISTVKGLQYAYANPNTYTVHVLTTSTPNYIQTVNNFNMSAGLRQAIIEEIQKNNMVVCPNKLISDGAYTGFVGVILDPNTALGLYAIGDQIQNGAWATDSFVLKQWKNEQNQPQYAYQLVNGPQQFLYKDNSDNSIMCSMKVATYNSIVNGNLAQGWDETKYGKPCMDDNENGPYKFGTHDHSLILSTNGAYFKSVSDNYSVWQRNSLILNKLQQVLPNNNLTLAKVYKYLGTYAYAEGMVPSEAGGKAKQMAVYNPKLNEAYVIGNKEEVEKYTSNELIVGQYVRNLLGYPSSAEAKAANPPLYFDPPEQYYQQYTNGTVYFNPQGIFKGRAIVVVGGINLRHNLEGGSSIFGFPVRDPQLTINGNGEIYQDFYIGNPDGETIVGNLNNDNSRIEARVTTISVNRDFVDGEKTDFEEGIHDAFAEIDIYDMGVNFLAGFTAGELVNVGLVKVAEKYGSWALVKIGARYIPFVGWALFSISSGLALDANGPLIEACAMNPNTDVDGLGKRPAYYCGKLGVYAAIYGAGVGANVGASKAVAKLNNFGVFTSKARSGKQKLFRSIVNDQNWIPLKKTLTGDGSFNQRSVRDAFFQRVDELTELDIKRLAARPDISQRLVSNPDGLTTFNGLTDLGSVKYRVDLRYANEFPNYKKPNAFSMPKLLSDGLTKEGFFGAGELDDAISIFKQKNLGKIVGGQPVGEIIYVKKLDGSTILTPRYTSNNYPLPHPYIVGGEDALAAGTIIPDPLDSKKITITNATGHYKVYKDDIRSVIEELQQLGFSVINKAL